MSLIERAIAKKLQHANVVPAPTTERVAAQRAVQIRSHAISDSDASRSRPAQLPPKDFVSAPEPEAVTIDIDSLRDRGFVTPDGPPGLVGQDFRVIKRPLLTNAYGRGGAADSNARRVMVTSAYPGEGKSFCAINLAMSIAAERDHSVLLVDADVAKPSIPNELRIPARPGLMDWLIDGSPDIGQLVLPTNVTNLSVLQSGRRDPRATEFLASTSMARLLDELSARFPDRIVIFDSPPLMVTTESRVLASYMGQIVMVVEAGRTPRDSVTEAIGTLESSMIVGLLLNKSREKRRDSYNGYKGYGYGYDS